MLVKKGKEVRGRTCDHGSDHKVSAGDGVIVA